MSMGGCAGCATEQATAGQCGLHAHRCQAGRGVRLPTTFSCTSASWPKVLPPLSMRTNRCTRELPSHLAWLHDCILRGVSPAACTSIPPQPIRLHNIPCSRTTQHKAEPCLGHPLSPAACLPVAVAVYATLYCNQPRRCCCDMPDLLSSLQIWGCPFGCLSFLQPLLQCTCHVLGRVWWLS